MAVDASIPGRERCWGKAAGHEDAEAALFAAVRGRAEAVIRLAGSEQALGLEHEELEKQAMQAGFEFMRLLTQAHLDLRTGPRAAPRRRGGCGRGRARYLRGRACDGPG